MRYKILKRFPDYMIYEDSSIYSLKTKKFLSPKLDKNGYRIFCLVDKDGKRRMVRRGRLILTAHVRPPKRNEQCNHLSLDKEDDSLPNLRWSASPGANTRHYWRTRRQG